MKSADDIKADIERIGKYHENSTATRDYLRVIAELLLDIREQSKKHKEDVIEVLRHQRFQ
jgi:hypothetical protein